MSAQSFTIIQDIFKQTSPSFHVNVVREQDVDEPLLRVFLAGAAGTQIIGVAPAYGSKCVLAALAFATSRQVLIVQVAVSKKRNSAIPRGRSLLSELVLRNSSYDLLSFNMDRLAGALFLDLNLRITAGVDLQSTLPRTSDRRSGSCIMDALGGETTLHKVRTLKVFQDEKYDKQGLPDFALRAWAACRVGTLDSMSEPLSRVARIDTTAFRSNQLRMLATTLRDADRLDALKPTVVKNDISAQISQKSGKLLLNSTRFKSRIRTSSNQTIRIDIGRPGQGSSSVSGKVTRVNGKAAHIALRGSPATGTVKSAYTIGKEDPTNAETQRVIIVLRTLQRSMNILAHPFVRRIWFPSETPGWSVRGSAWPVVPIDFPRPLNVSQRNAVDRILRNAEDDRIAIIHGPPGTGKTTVIAAATLSIISGSGDRTVWLVAQSNVAIKNVAEKLADSGFLDWKLLISKEFHFDWHEHLYERIVGNIVISNDFPQNIVATERLLMGPESFYAH